MDITIKELVYGSDDYEKSIDIRNEVFRKPWGLNIRDEDLTVDKDMQLFGAYLEDEIIGTIFLTEKDSETAQIKSVTLLPEYQNRGFGKYLMEYTENLAREQGYTKCFLMGRVSKLYFYEKMGYEKVGEPFDYQTIPHINMIKSL
ncbi:MAG: GNAT family N-acetyltransferase [Tissierellia bacterium]|nr:GNAT family N-acetyltransferase [Tissierellia bacterium]